MKLRWISLSVLVHILTITIIISQKPEPSVKKEIEKFLKAHNISEKDLQKLISKKIKIQEQKKTVRTTIDKPKRFPTLEEIYLGKQNNSTEKNTVVKNTGEFLDAPKSITKKGKFTDEGRGKGISASDDFVLGASIGPKTILNTQEFKYFSYYQKLRDRVVETWRPLIRKAIKQVKDNPKKYGTLTVGLKITKVNVVLDPKGNILGFEYVGISGIEAFDICAEKAFKMSAPFPGVPKELVENGEFSVRWDFTISVEDAGLVDYKGGQAK